MDKVISIWLSIRTYIPPFGAKNDLIVSSDVHNSTEDTPMMASIASIARLVLTTECPERLACVSSVTRPGLTSLSPAGARSVARLVRLYTCTLTVHITGFVTEVSGEAADQHHPGHRPRDGGEEGAGHPGGQCWEAVAATMYYVQMH